MMENNIALKSSNYLTEQTVQNEMYTLIEINEKIFAIKTNNVLEIIKVIELDYPNVLPSCVLGLLKYNNNPVGVIDLREVLKTERIIYGISSKIIVIKIENNLSAIICDKVQDIKKIPSDKIYSVPFQEENNFYDGIYTQDNENIYILNMQNVIDYICSNPELFKNENNKQRYIIDTSEAKETLKERKDFITKITQEIQTVKPLYDMGVSFLINNVKYYINMSSVKEFFKLNNQKFIKIPSTPSFILGLINIKGEYVTVLDIRNFYGNPKTQIKEKSTIIILNSDEFKLGILADEICENMNIDYEELKNKSNKHEENQMGEFVQDGEVYQIIDTDKLFKDSRLTIA